MPGPVIQSSTVSQSLPPAETSQELDFFYDMIREMSLQTDPQEMVRAYSRRMDAIMPVNRRISLSRRGLEKPWFRITRFSEWQADINPWQQQNELPLRQGGLFSELLFGNYPRIIDDLQQLQLAGDDPPCSS